MDRPVKETNYDLNLSTSVKDNEVDDNPKESTYPTTNIFSLILLHFQELHSYLQNTHLLVEILICNDS